MDYRQHLQPHSGALLLLPLVDHSAVPQHGLNDMHPGIFFCEGYAIMSSHILEWNPGWALRHHGLKIAAPPVRWEVI